MKKQLMLLFFFSMVSLANSLPETSRNIIHLLNYIASDYPGAVQNGKILSLFEYKEQKEFSKSIIEIANQEEKFRTSSSIQSGLNHLNRLVLDKASAEEIRKTTDSLKTQIFEISALPRSPEKWPNIKHGKEIYSQQCAQCHGVSGQGDGPSGGELDPKPANFLDAKNDLISPFQYFNAVRLGVPGTAMAAFESISEKETWDLAFYLSSIRHTEKVNTAISTHPWTLEQVASLSDHELLNSSEKPSEKTALALSLARTFEVSEGSQTTLLSLTEQNLEASIEAFKNKNFELAKSKAIAAYLDGIEPLEPKLRINNPEFTIKLEEALSSFRKQIDERVTSEELDRTSFKIKGLLFEAKTVLETKPSSFWVTYSVAGSIFLREALEAALLLITLLGVVRAFGNPKAIYFIHGGWISAFGVGLVCWFFSGWVMGISGLRREVLEGSISLLAVIVLLYLGYWLHRKTEISKWRIFINELVKTALDSKKLIGLAVVSFMGVFREAFETVLFLRALLIESPGQETALGLGVLSALVAVLIASSIAIKYSAKLPLKQLFTLSSMMMLFLAFILIGKSIHAFQEAGMISETLIGTTFRIERLGLFSTMENLIPQLTLILVSVFIWGKQPKTQSVENPMTTLEA